MRTIATKSFARAGALRFVILSIVFLASIITPAPAHFLLNLNVRILHVEHLADGLTVYLRTPMPYLVADRIGPVGSDGLPIPAPYTFNRMENGKVAHYVDPDQVARDAKGLGSFVAKGFHLEANGQTLQAEIEEARVYPIETRPGFATLTEAKAAFESGGRQLTHADPLFVGDAAVDVILRYRTGNPVYDYRVSSTLDPGLPGQEDTANLILDYGPGGTKVFRARGLLTQPVEISRSPLWAILSFVKEGIRHILEGWDHVLFVVCLVIGAAQLKDLIWRVTGFTIGHSVTLSAGFFGFVPSGAWFVPAVETGIALSIIYAATIAVMPSTEHNHTGRNMFLVTCGIGLLHGLGFSFVLHQILQVDSPNIWQSLLAFNVGVEIGQLAIILIVWPAFVLLQHMSKTGWKFGRLGVAGMCAAIAVFWAGQRALSLVESL